MISNLSNNLSQSVFTQDSGTTVSSEDDEVSCGMCGVMYGMDNKHW